MKKKTQKKAISNGVFYVVISLVAVIGIGFGVAAYNGPAPQVVVEGDYIQAEGNVAEPTVGAFPGPDVYADVDIFGTLITDSGSYNNSTTTDSTTYTLVAKDIQRYGYLEFDFTAGAAISYTMPATSTMMSILPEIGSNRTWTIHNASTTAVMTIVAGAGMDLVGIDANADTIAGDGWAELKCMQIDYIDATNENIMCMISEYIDAD